MHIVSEGVTAKGLHYVIRYPEMDDVRSAWEYINRLSKERTFVRFQGEEVSMEDEERFITHKRTAIREQRGVTLFLVVNDAVMGISSVDLNDKTENHVAVFGISIDASVRGHGLGEVLMRATMAEAETNLADLKIITLRMKAPNAAARSLYEKVGFTEYGLLPQGTQHAGAYVDDVLMYYRCPNS